jgi:hypothetical protein
MKDFSSSTLSFWPQLLKSKREKNEREFQARFYVLSNEEEGAEIRNMRIRGRV